MADFTLIPSWEPFRWNLAELMNKAPEVRWDRCVQHEDLIRLYGWVDRPDGRADFVLLDAHSSELDGEPAMQSSFLTSSAELSAALADRVLHGENDPHVDCERIEDLFGDQVTHAVRLAR